MSYAACHTPHCQNCGSTDREDLTTGDQGYTACCNEPVEYEQCEYEHHVSNLAKPPTTGAAARAEARRLDGLANEYMRGTEQRRRLLTAATAMYVLSDELGGE